MINNLLLLPEIDSKNKYTFHLPFGKVVSCRKLILINLYSGRHFEWKNIFLHLICFRFFYFSRFFYFFDLSSAISNSFSAFSASLALMTVSFSLFSSQEYNQIYKVQLLYVMTATIISNIFLKNISQQSDFFNDFSFSIRSMDSAACFADVWLSCF